MQNCCKNSEKKKKRIKTATTGNLDLVECRNRGEDAFLHERKSHLPLNRRLMYNLKGEF
jgi:hypothetical protein